MGYAGGTTSNPTYDLIGDHTESFQIKFDSDLVTFTEILQFFWESYNPGQPPRSTQYKSIIFYQNDSQLLEIEDFLQRKSDLKQALLLPEVKNLTHFYSAEGYHQKYFIRQNPLLMTVMNEIFSDDKEFYSSTLAARINGFLGGNSTISELETEIIECGISKSEVLQIIDLMSTATVSY